MLYPGKYEPLSKRIYGYDIETYDNNRKFYCASIYDLLDGTSKTFMTKRETIGYLGTLHDSVIIATNLLFDWMGTFHKEKEEELFKLLFRGSNLLRASSYSVKGKFDSKRSYAPCSVTFLDTFNYAPMGVAKLGKLIGIKKLPRPKALGKVPLNESEKKELVLYNQRDSEVSAKAFKFLIDGFQVLGSSFKPTVASSSMSLFRNKYLDKKYYRHDIPTLLEQFDGYYGGRTEAFSRGYIPDGYRLYDFNSLYPSVMLDAYPDPNTLRMTMRSGHDILEYEGMSYVTINVPLMKYPLLPFRQDHKLLFPCGQFSGWYSHEELRKAIELDCKIISIRKSYYYTDVCHPFREFVLDLYKKRKEYIEEDNPMQMITKLMMNSLYGKFGQKFTDRDEWIHTSMISLEKLQKYEDVERMGMYFKIKKDMTRPANFCFPIWASHVTAKGRLKLHDYLVKSDAVYCDTDSLITRKFFPSSIELGRLKLERIIHEGIIVRPKFYAIKGDDVAYAKVKGLGTKISYSMFPDLLKNKRFAYQKFMRFKESMRRKSTVNIIVDMEKAFSLEDDKRHWNRPFKMYEWQESIPRMIESPISNTRSVYAR